jgi:hypothetical protein
MLWVEEDMAQHVQPCLGAIEALVGRRVRPPVLLALDEVGELRTALPVTEAASAAARRDAQEEGRRRDLQVCGGVRPSAALALTGPNRRWRRRHLA